MKKNDYYLLKLLLKVFIIVCSTVLSALCYSKVSILSGVCWTITAIIWGMNLENQITHNINREYTHFLEFALYNCMCVIKKQEGELNAKSKQDNKGAEHKGE